MLNKLTDILSIQSESYNQFRMFAYVIRQLKKIDCEYYVYNGCIYVTKGNASSFPCIVSHLDTVHEICEDLTVIQIGDNLTGFNSVTMSQTGIGGDDKVGIFIALQCLEKFENIKAAFFRDEEVGCEGSYEPDDDFFSDCGFVLQCDRKGNKDFITKAGGVRLSDKDFQRDVKFILNKYGYKFESGLMTDVMALKQCSIECSMANISCGYYNPHSVYEFVNVPDVLKCLNFVFEIITTLNGRAYVCNYDKPVYKSVTSLGGNKYLDRWDNWGDWDGIPDKIKTVPIEYCDCCRELADVVTYVPEYNVDMCNKCMKAMDTMKI
jgi:putative aminopeptidase FrvX